MKLVCQCGHEANVPGAGKFRCSECGTVTVLPPIPADTDKACVVCGDTNANWSYDYGKCWYCGKHRQPI